jgi:hypothetical protein
MRKTGLGRFGLVLELALLAASLGTGGPVAAGIRIIGLIVAALLAALVIFVGVVLSVAVVEQRRPPYRFCDRSWR